MNRVRVEARSYDRDCRKTPLFPLCHAADVTIGDGFQLHSIFGKVTIALRRSRGLLIKSLLIFGKVTTADFRFDFQTSNSSLCLWKGH